MITNGSIVQDWLSRHSRLTEGPSPSTVEPNTYDLSDTDIPTVDELAERFRAESLHYRDHVAEEDRKRIEFADDLTTTDRRRTFTTTPSRSGLVITQPPKDGRPPDEFRISPGVPTNLRYRDPTGRVLYKIEVNSGDQSIELGYNWDDFAQPETGDGARYVSRYDYIFLRAFLRTFDHARDYIRFQSSSL